MLHIANLVPISHDLVDLGNIRLSHPYALSGPRATRQVTRHLLYACDIHV